MKRKGRKDQEVKDEDKQLVPADLDGGRWVRRRRRRQICLVMEETGKQQKMGQRQTLFSRSRVAEIGKKERSEPGAEGRRQEAEEEPKEREKEGSLPRQPAAGLLLLLHTLGRIR